MSERLQPTSTFSLLRRFVRHFRLPAFCTGGLLVLVAAFYLVENWRGARRFAQVKKVWEAKGEKLDWAAFIPPAVPDDENDENVAAHPLLRPLCQYEARPALYLDPNGLKRVEGVRLPHERPPRPAPRAGGVEEPVIVIEQESDLLNTTVDLTYWQTRFRLTTNFPSSATPGSPAKDVLLALGRFESELRELHNALSRSQSRFPLRYDEDPTIRLMRHLSSVRGLAEVLHVRAAAFIVEGRQQEASQDIGDLFALASSVKDEPATVSFQVRLVIHQWGCERVLQGLEHHLWTEPQLVKFQAANKDLIAGASFALKGELAGRLRTLDLYAKGDFYCLPRGWFEQNKAALADYFYKRSLSALDPAARRIFPNRAQAASDESDRRHRLSEGPFESPYTFFANMLLPGVTRLLRHAARAQTLNDITFLACALERHRLAHGRLPETLSMLVPDFLSTLPRDVLSGDLLKYRRGTDGRCVLWSVGWNERDNGGQIKRIGKRNIVVAESDWIFEWQAQP